MNVSKPGNQELRIAVLALPVGVLVWVLSTVVAGALGSGPGLIAAIAGILIGAVGLVALIAGIWKRLA